MVNISVSTDSRNGGTVALSEGQETAGLDTMAQERMVLDREVLRRQEGARGAQETSRASNAMESAREEISALPPSPSAFGAAALTRISETQKVETQPELALPGQA